MRSTLMVLALAIMVTSVSAVLPPDAQEALERQAVINHPEVQAAIANQASVEITRTGEVYSTSGYIVRAGDVTVTTRIVYGGDEITVPGPAPFEVEVVSVERGATQPTTMPMEPSPDETIGMGTSVRGTLELTDNAVLEGDDRAAAGYARDGHAFEAEAGTTIVVALTCDFDGFLILVGPDGQIIDINDDADSIHSSRIQSTLSQSGGHRIVVSSYAPGVGGDYTLTLTPLLTDLP
jgi:hypothetical protein